MDRGRLIPPKLDDRSWQEIVDQTKALIPKYTKEWTDQSPSDLGITLLELFAWIAEGMIYRLNKVPEKSYLTLLNLIGITRDPATPARTVLRFQTDKEGTLSKGLKVSTPPTETNPGIVFETEDDVVISNFKLKYVAHVGDKAPIPMKWVEPPFAPLVLNGSAQEQVVYFGFEGEPPQEFSLLAHVSKHDASTASTTWHYIKTADGEFADISISNIKDGTNAFTSVGTRSIIFNDVTTWRWTAASIDTIPGTGESLYWLKLSIPKAVKSTIDFIISNAAIATTAITVNSPEMFIANGKPFFSIDLAHTPVYKKPNTADPFSHVNVRVDGVPWTRYDELPSGVSKGYMLNPVTGTITFGNHDSQASPDGHGSIPEPKTTIEVTYRYVASGDAGNVGPGLLTIPVNPTRNVNLTVTNVVAATSGADEEPIEETIRRAPGALRNRSRAVTADDYEYLTREASREVAIVRCLQGAFFPGDTFNKDIAGQVTVLIVPTAQENIPKPQPTEDLLATVKAFLNDRRILGTKLDVRGPAYKPINVTINLTFFPNIDPSRREPLRAELKAQVEKILHPIHGGPNRNGWEIGQAVTPQTILTQLQFPQEFGYISDLSFNDKLRHVLLGEHELVFAGKVTVNDAETTKRTRST
jgi:hypothetical protein